MYDPPSMNLNYQTPAFSLLSLTLKFCNDAFNTMTLTNSKVLSSKVALCVIGHKSCIT